MPDQKKKIGLSEAAHRLGVSYNHAHRLALIGDLDAEHTGDRWYVTRESVDRMVEQRSQDPQTTR